MDEEYLERELSILTGRKRYQKTYSSASEFKNHLKEAALAQEKLRWGWVFWQDSKQKILTLLKHIASNWWHGYHYLVQFWAVVKVEGRHHYLSTSRQPFCVPFLKNELCWYRNLCIDHLCRVDMEEVAEEEQLGGVGRAYRNKHPESTPDLRLYSTNEFPLRDQAARCRLTAYLALPLFDFHNNQCYGVLELLSHDSARKTKLLCTMDQGLQIAGLRSTHINFVPISRCTTEMPDKYKQQHEREITEIFELAIKAVPQLYLAQVWVPCKQCASKSISTNLRCMERASFINAQEKIVNLCKDVDTDIFDYLEACEFHNLQIDDLSYFRRNFCDLRISKNPLAHHAMRARLSSCFAFRVQNVKNSNKLYVIEFFLQPKCRKDAWNGSSLHFLLRIVEMKLEGFKFVSREQLPEELVAQSWQPNAIECESLDMLNVMTNSNEEIFTESNFTKYLETVQLCCLRPSSKESNIGWVFCILTGNESSRKEIISESLPVPIPIKNEVSHFMKKIAVKSREHCKWIVQFWVPKMAEDRCYLETSDQPYAVGCLAKGLASFRMKCIKHHYFVDDEAKEEELGPPGRVFRNGHPEITPDLFLYTTKEFSLRNYAVQCGLRGYFVLPVFDKRTGTVGVLEFIGLCYSKIDIIERELEDARLCSTHIGFSPRFIPKGNPTKYMFKQIKCRKQALTEVTDAFHLSTNIPQLHMSKVWVLYEKCVSINSNSRCMELVLCCKNIQPTGDQVHWIHVQPGKGIIGMVLDSENKACFCRNLCEFSIVDQPQAHNERGQRLGACFVICLQSSHTGDLLYVLEFFLNQSPQHLQSFFSFLLPIMKQKLKSFRYASGKQLGEELVVEVIEFSEANNLTFYEKDQPEVFPIKFKSVWYGKMEHQNDDMQVEYVQDDATQTKQCSTVAASDFKKTDQRGERKTGHHLSLEVLKLHFGKKLDDVAEVLGVGKSTIKRASRRYGILRWPCNEKQARNPSLFKRESTQDSQQDVRPSSSSSLQLSDTSLHQKVLHTNTQNTQHLIVHEEAEQVIINVQYEQDTIKFELCLSVGVSKLFQEVARRINRKIGSFKLKYRDEDGEEILITSDDDLQLCPKSRTAMGKTCIQLFVPK